MSSAAFASSARRAAAGTCSARTTSTRPSSVWHQTPTIRPSHHAVGPPLPLRSKTFGAVLPEMEGAFLPAHRGRVERRQQGHPRRRVGRRVEVVGQDPSGGTAVERDLDRRHVGERPAHGRLGRAQPPHQVGLGARTERPEPGRHQRGVPLGLGQRRRRLPQPVGRRRPARTRDLPAAVVHAAYDGTRGRERDDHAGGDRDVGLVLPLAAGHPGVEGGQPRTHLGGRQRPVRLDQAAAPGRGAPRPRRRRRG